MKFENSKSIAEYYLRGCSDALTDNQEITDLSNDINEYATGINRELLKSLQDTVSFMIECSFDFELDFEQQSVLENAQELINKIKK